MPNKLVNRGAQLSISAFTPGPDKVDIPIDYIITTGIHFIKWFKINKLVIYIILWE